MKLSNLVASVAAALAIGATAANAQPVTLYGVLDAGMGYTNVKIGDRSATKVGGAYGIQAPNLIGFRGQEDLGEGNTVNFVLETGFDLGTGQDVMGSLFGRQATVGVANSKWGSVNLGRKQSASTEAFVPVDPFGLSFSQASAGTAFGVVNRTRYSNMVEYNTPDFAGFSAGVGYSFATGLDAIYPGVGVVSGNASGFETNNNTRAVTLAGKYAKGPVYVVATYDAIYADDRFKSSLSSDNVNAWTLGAVYDFKVAKVSAAYGQTRNGYINGQRPLDSDGVYTSWSNGGILFRDGFDTNSYLVGVSAPVTQRVNVMGSWARLQPTGSWGNTEVSRNQDAYNLGATYAFSKRTSGYAAISYVNNFSMVEGRSTMFATGLTHSF